mgnify:CR=1 FL=1
MPREGRLVLRLHQREVDLRLLEVHADHLHFHPAGELVLHAAPLAAQHVLVRIELEVVLPQVGDVHQAVDVQLVERHELTGPLGHGHLLAVADEVYGGHVVRVEDAEKADTIFSKLMGTEVELRKSFIQANAKFVKDLDI